MTVKLNGIIFRKAELDKDFEKVYTRVFEKMYEMNFFSNEDVLEIFGDVSGWRRLVNGTGSVEGVEDVMEW